MPFLGTSRRSQGSEEAHDKEKVQIHGVPISGSAAERMVPDDQIQEIGLFVAFSGVKKWQILLMFASISQRIYIPPW
jgi:hypothetical protein